jgi:hypothetical protein
MAWIDDLKPGASWWGIWYGLIHCDRCNGLMSSSGACPACGRTYTSDVDTLIVNEGHRVPGLAFQGAIAWSTHILLALMKNEWERPLAFELFPGTPAGKKPSQRVIIVILFWTLFEDLMNRFFEAAMHDLPEGVRKDLLRRYSTVGSRFDQLYRILFRVTFRNDLVQIGHQDIADHLKRVQDRRNEFVHGNPEAIDDDLVSETVLKLQDVQAAWVQIFNRRCTGKPGRQVWEG